MELDSVILANTQAFRAIEVTGKKRKQNPSYRKSLCTLHPDIGVWLEKSA